MIDLPAPGRRNDAPIWLAVPSRFAGLSQRGALIGIFLLTLLLSVAVATSAIDMRAASSGTANEATDIVLYQTIVEAVRAGDSYYSAAVDAHRADAYPLRPFVTVRMPTLAVILAALPPLAAALLQWALALAVVIVWMRRLWTAVPRPPARFAGAVMIAGGMIVFVDVDLAAFHELWAAMLVALSLGLRRSDRWVEAVALGLMAMLIRETAGLYAMLMAVLAWAEGNRREAVGWGIAIAIFAAALGLHGHAVLSATTPLDLASRGWSGLHGFGLFVRAITLATALQGLPLVLAAALVGIALLGWAAWNDPVGLRMLVTVSGYAALIGVFGRIDTFYWALMIAPIFLVGLVFAPDGVRDLVTRALDRRRARVIRIER